MPRRYSSPTRSTSRHISVLLFWVLAILAFKTLSFDRDNIPSKSMAPTLLVGDNVFVSKTSYGWSQASFSWSSFPFTALPSSARIMSSDAKRGDIVVFRPPGQMAEQFVKRVIGLPGDTIQMRAGRLYINGIIVPRQQIENYIDPEEPLCPCRQYLETLPGGVLHPIVESAGDTGPFDNTPIYLVPAGHYFMMGDNRDNSNDSRAFADRHAPSQMLSLGHINQQNGRLLGPVGFVPAGNLVGPARYILYSWNLPLEFRWERFFTRLK